MQAPKPGGNIPGFGSEGVTHNEIVVCCDIFSSPIKIMQAPKPGGNIPGFGSEDVTHNDIAVIFSALLSR